MIIQCKQCATKFRFNDELMTGDGVWVRCGRCGHEFFEINTRRETFVPPAQKELPPARPEPPAARKTEAAPAPPEAAPARQEPAAAPKPLTPADATAAPAAATTPPADEELTEEDAEEEAPRGSFWTPSRIVVYSILVLLVVIGVYLWLFPGIGRDALNFVYPGTGDRVLGPAAKTTASVATPGGINFAEVKERFTKSTASGELLVISGLAVNEFDYPVARVRLRGKILDNTGKMLGEIETFAGNLLTDEELNRLTDKEILAELQRQEGSDMPNVNIRSRASIPFMIVFMNPPKEVDEFIIELSGVERSAASN